MRVFKRFRTKIMWVRSCIIAPPFVDGWINKKCDLRYGHSIKLLTAESYPLLLKSNIWNRLLEILIDEGQIK